MKRNTIRKRLDAKDSNEFLFSTAAVLTAEPADRLYARVRAARMRDDPREVALQVIRFLRELPEEEITDAGEAQSRPATDATR